MSLRVGFDHVCGTKKWWGMVAWGMVVGDAVVRSLGNLISLLQGMRCSWDGHVAFMRRACSVHEMVMWCS